MGAFPDTLTPAEKVVYWTIILTWPFYAIGALYVVGPVMGWALGGFAAFALYFGPLMRPDMKARTPPVIILLSFVAMFGMLVVLWVGQNDYGFGTGQIIKSSIGWAKGWALFPLYLTIGACLFIRMEVVSRAYCVLGLHTLILLPLFILAPKIGLPEKIFTSPLKAVGGPGPEYFTVFLYTIDPANGMPRWQFFTPWSPFAGLVGVVTVLCALEEKNRFWMACGLLAGLAMVLMTKSRMSIVGLVVCVGIPRGMPLLFKPWACFAAAMASVSMVMFGDRVAVAMSDARSHFREMRANSTRVRDALKRIAKERWASEAFWFGHGSVEPGSHVTEHMLGGAGDPQGLKPALGPHLVPRAAQGGDQIAHMLDIAGLDHDVEFGLFQGHALHHPLVDHLDHIRPAFTDDAGDIRQLPRRIRDFESQAHDAPIAHQPAQDQGRQHPRIDIAATDDQPHPLAAIGIEPVADDRQPGPRRALGHQLFIALAATAMPAIRPPPPTGTTMVSRSGCCSSISTATVPCPAATTGSSNGWMKIKPRASARSSVCCTLSSKPVPCSTTSAPKSRVRCTLLNGVPMGITMVAGMSRRLA